VQGAGGSPPRLTAACTAKRAHHLRPGPRSLHALISAQRPGTPASPVLHHPGPAPRPAGGSAPEDYSSYHSD